MLLIIWIVSTQSNKSEKNYKKVAKKVCPPGTPKYIKVHQSTSKSKMGTKLDHFDN